MLQEGHDILYLYSFVQVKVDVDDPISAIWRLA